MRPLPGAPPDLDTKHKATCRVGTPQLEKGQEESNGRERRADKQGKDADTRDLVALGNKGLVGALRERGNTGWGNPPGEDTGRVGWKSREDLKRSRGILGETPVTDVPGKLSLEKDLSEIFPVLS